MGDHGAPEAGHQLQVEWDVELVPAAVEVLVELPGDVVGASGHPHDARADLPGELVEDRVVAFEFERDPHQAGGAGRDEQRTDRAVDDAVGDIEQCLVIGTLGQPGAERVEVRSVGVEAGGQCGDECVVRVDGVRVHAVCVHDVSFLRVVEREGCRSMARSAAMPSAALRRAAGDGAVEEHADLGVGEVGQVAVGDGVTLLRRQPVHGRAQIPVETGPVEVGPVETGAIAGSVERILDREWRAIPRPDLVDRLAVGDCDEPGAHVTVGAQVGVGAQGRDERLRPGVLGGGIGAEHSTAHAHHHRPVLVDDRLERREAHYSLSPSVVDRVLSIPDQRCTRRSCEVRPPILGTLSRFCDADCSLGATICSMFRKGPE